MQDLTPVGLSQDGTRLLLTNPAGEEFAVGVNTRLRAALRGENTRLGQLEKTMDSALRPRDIQARIRAGESPEDVAAAAQTTVESIMGFAVPVLAERDHVAKIAMSGSVRRRSGEASSAGRTLGEAAEMFLGDHRMHHADVAWDAWRRPDGRWALVASYDLAGRPRTAEFTYDLPGRYVLAENDEARVLSGELREPEADRPAAGRTAASRRLSSVPSQDQLPLGDDAIELVREPAAQEPSGTLDSSSATPEPGSHSTDVRRADSAEWIAVDGAAPLDEPLEVPSGHTEPTAAGSETVAAGPEAVEGDDAGKHAVAGNDPQHGPEKPRRSATASKKKGRSSVPSWEDIMFGGGNTE